MSQYTHKEFIATATAPTAHHQMTPITRPYPSYFRIVLRSVDRDAGSTNTNAYFSGVTLNKRFSTPAVLVVNSFSLENADSGAQANNILELRLGGVPHPTSFDTSNKSATDLLCVVNGYTYQNQSPTADAVGLPIIDPNQFQNSRVNVYFKYAGNEAMTTFTGNWTLVLDLIALDGSLAY